MPIVQTVKDDLRGAESYVVQTSSKVYAWILAHWYFTLPVVYLVGWASAAYFYHHVVNHCK